MIVALDVGSKRIGVAISDPGESFALPLTTIERTNVRADVRRIVDIAAEYGASEIAVGYPIALSGERGLAAERMDAFIAHLERDYTGAIVRVDERLTSAQANKVLISADVSRAKRKGSVDKLAAALILETHLSRRRNASGSSP